MALDVSSIQSHPQAVLETARQGNASPRTQEKTAAADLESIAADLGGDSPSAARRLSFSVNDKLDEVVVKVIDTDTDKVVREIPPVELQHVYERIREVVGILFDRRA
jgi:flagellar protein FlaG